MPTTLPLSADLVAASEDEASGKLWFAAERAALAEIGDPLGRSCAIQNLSLAFSVAASALTIAYKTRAGANATSTDPISVAMRNATLATMDFNVRNIIAALSLVVPSTATLGHTSAVAGDLYHYVIDNAGTLEPAVSMKYFGQQGIVSTTTIAGASNSATTMYSTTGRSNVAFRCVGHTIDTQATAGTWAAVPTTSELEPFDAPGIGNVQFPATQSPSADPNTLDDYEEGTWTPSVGGTATYGAARAGTYTKIGRVVHLSCIMQVATIGTGNTQSISGLPFLASATGSIDFVQSVFWSNLTAAYVHLLSIVPAGGNTLSLYGATAAAASLAQAFVIGSGTVIESNGSYVV